MWIWKKKNNKNYLLTIENKIYSTDINSILTYEQNVFFLSSVKRLNVAKIIKALYKIFNYPKHFIDL